MRHAFIMEINMEGTWVPTMVSIETTARACEAIHESARVRRLKTIAQWRVAITALRNLACPNAERREDEHWLSSSTTAA